MEEYTSPGGVETAPGDTLVGSVLRRAETAPDRPAVAWREGDRFAEWSMRELAGEIRAVAKGLLAIGVDKGDAVAIFSGTRREWTVLDFALWAAGAISVPIYETSSPEQVEWILSDSGAIGILISTPELRAVYDGAEVPEAVRHALVVDEGALDELKRQGAGVGDDVLDERLSQLTGSDVATIVYTSGTTGRPKGCVIDHANLSWEVDQVSVALPQFLRPGESTLLFLPLAHILARVIQASVIREGALLAYASSVDHVVEELQLVQPTFLVAVPRVFEKVFNGARQKAAAEGKGRIFDLAARVAEDWSRQQRAGRARLGTRLLHRLFDRLVYRRLRDALGGRARYAVSGGAALGERLGHFFDGIGLPVMEGYGLTETTAAATVGRPDAMRIGTVGKPVPGGSIRIAEDGEILIRGGHVFRGYHNDPAATAAAMDGEWLRSGDLGELDGEGYLRVTGRKKDILVTAGGQNVAPGPLEDRLRSHALISQAVVLGDGRPFVAALLTLDAEAIGPWAQSEGKEGRGAAELIEDVDLLAELQRAIDDANRSVSRAESIRTFRIVPEDFTVGDELSQKMSVRRHVVMDKHAALIDDIYGARV